MLQKPTPEDHDKLGPTRTSVHPGISLALILFGFGLGAGAYRLAGYFSNGSSSTVAIETYEKASHLVREGERIKVPPDASLRRKLTVDVVSAKEIERTLVLPAAVEADPARLIKILPPLTGRITKLMVQLGERVEIGQPLLVFDSPDLAAAYADYDRAKVLMELAVKNRDRQRGLVKIGGTAEKDLQQAETDYVTAEAEYVRAGSRLRQIGVDADTTNKSRTVTIAAPISGSVTDLAAAPGAFWNDQTAALMTVADLSTVWVTANVPEKDTSRIAKGQAVDVTFASYAGEVFKGQVLFVSDVLDQDTRRMKVRIEFQNPGARLKPNMFANVSFSASKQSLPAVPTAALVLKNEADQVFVEVEPWVFEERPVEIAFQEGDQAVIKSGLKAGDRVVVKGGVLLND